MAENNETLPYKKIFESDTSEEEGCAAVPKSCVGEDRDHDGEDKDNLHDTKKNNNKRTLDVIKQKTKETPAPAPPPTKKTKKTSKDSKTTPKTLPRRGEFANEKGRVKLEDGTIRYYDPIQSDASRKRLVFLGAYDKTSRKGLTREDIVWNASKKRYVNKKVSNQTRNNKWMIALNNARKNNAETFEYNNKSYVKDVTKTGMTIYRSKKTNNAIVEKI